MSTQLSPMRPEDYAAVRTLWTSSDGVGLDKSDDEAHIVAYLERNPGLSWVARDTQAADTQAIVAAVLCGHDGRRGYLTHLAVAGTYRNQGIGRQLVERCLAQLASEGILKCTIHVYADNADGIAFWERLGFSARTELNVLQRAT